MSKASAVLKVAPGVHDSSAGLGEADREAIAEMLSELTVQSYRVLLRTQVVRWNVVGPRFRPVRALTEQHYSDMFAAIDAIAERIRALGHPAPTGRAALGLDKALSMGAKMTPKTMVDELVEDHEALVRLLRESADRSEDLSDFVTHDFLTARLAFHETAIWMLRAVVADEPVGEGERTTTWPI